MEFERRSNANPFFYGLDGVSTPSDDDTPPRASHPEDDELYDGGATSIDCFEMSVAGYKFYGTHVAAGHEHQLNVGMTDCESNPNVACVRLMHDDRSPESADLSWIGWESTCSHNVPLKRGREGTMVMLVASLRYMMEVFERVERVELMDTSKKEFELPRSWLPDRVTGTRRTIDVPLGDLYSVTHTSRFDGACKTWYMAALGATPASPETSERLEMNALLLKRRVHVSGAEFARICFPSSSMHLDGAWLQSAASKTAAVVDAAGGTWGELLETIAMRVGGAVFERILRKLPDLLHGWRSVQGEAFTIHDARRVVSRVAHGVRPVVRFVRKIRPV